MTYVKASLTFTLYTGDRLDLCSDRFIPEKGVTGTTRYEAK
jgi:hypothetical protein